MFNYDIRNLTHEGDSLFAHIETTGHKYTNGTVMYRRPVGKNGLNMHIGYRHLQYSQGAEFKWLKPHGMARTYTFGLEYPIHRSQTHDLKVGLDYEYLDLKDEYRRGETYFPGPPIPAHAYGTWNDKHANAVTLSLSEKNLDKHGMTIWNLAYTYGHVSFDSPLTHTFFDNTNSEGAYSKITGMFLRHQKLNRRLALQLFARGQYVSRNMDTSGRMGITGITGVKAYPISEVAGDHAYFTRAELQWDLPLKAKMQKLQLLTYLEHGGIQIFKDPVNNDKNHRYLQDIGLGLLWSKKDSWWVRADYAWKLGSEQPVTDTSHCNGHFWIQGGICF
jgi:hemolysin activation/secretion protein